MVPMNICINKKQAIICKEALSSQDMHDLTKEQNQQPSSLQDSRIHFSSGSSFHTQDTSLSSSSDTNQEGKVRPDWISFFFDWGLQNLRHPFPSRELVKNVIKQSNMERGRKVLRRQDVDNWLDMYRQMATWVRFMQKFANNDPATVLEISCAVYYELQQLGVKMIDWYPAPRFIEGCTRAVRCENPDMVPYTLRDLFPRARRSYLIKMNLEWRKVAAEAIHAIERYEEEGRKIERKHKYLISIGKKGLIVPPVEQPPEGKDWSDVDFELSSEGFSDEYSSKEEVD